MYLEYHELLKKYKEAERRFKEALDKGGELYSSVMPKASQYQEVMVGGSHLPSDTKLINFVAERAPIDELINTTRNDMNILDWRLKWLSLRMKESNDIKDRIYYYKWIEHKSVYKFHKLIGYSVRQTYNFISEIKRELYN